MEFMELVAEMLGQGIVFVDIVLLIVMVMLAVLVPQAVAMVLVAVYRLLDHNVHLMIIMLIAIVAATMTTFIIRHIDEQINAWLDKLPKRRGGLGISRRIREWIMGFIDRVTHPGRLWIGTAMGSASVVPDIVLIELLRERMPFHVFMSAIAVGKCVTYVMLIGGAVGLFELVVL